MMTLTSQEIEILLDSPAQRDYVVSAYADLTVQDGFSRHVERELRNRARAARDALAEGEARKDLDANMAVIREAIAAASPSARGLAVFSSVGRGLRHVIPLGFPVENRLVLDEEPFVLPLLENWYGTPAYLVAVVNSDEAHLFEAHHGLPERVHDLERGDVSQDIQRDKPRFTYKKRFAKTEHERLHGAEDDKFLRDVAVVIDEHFRGGPFAGLILLGHPWITQPLRRLLPREGREAVVGEAPHAMTTQSEDLADDVSRIIAMDRDQRDRQLVAELQERRKRGTLLAEGPTEVLDALQQGRATQVLLGARHDLPGARCVDCDYRLGAPVEVCPYCQGTCRTVNAAQEIMRMAMRHRVPVQLLRNSNPKDDPLTPAGGVSAFVRAEADWAPSGTSVAAEKP
jgi:protein required for attachment to host cells